MFKNHLISILRNLKRNKGYATINISGLAIGFASAILIAIYVSQEFTYDKHFDNHERIYRLSNKNFAFSSIAHVNLLKENMAGIESTVNLMPNASGTLKYGSSSMIEPSVFYSTKDYLKVFSRTFVYGNPETAFDAPNAMLLTASMSQRMFGDKNPVGETVTLTTQSSTDLYLVSGVLEDLPENSHLKFKVLARFSESFERNISDSFNNTIGYAYIKMEQVAEGIQEQSDNVFGKYQYDLNGEQGDFETYLEEYQARFPLVMNIADVHLESNMQFEASPPGNKQYLYIFLGIAIFIIVLAGINYVNLATAQASKRAKEVGVRKVLGSKRQDLILRFILESFLLTLGAAIIGMGLAEASLQIMSNAGFTSFNVNVIDYPSLMLVILSTAAITGVLAGTYPSFFLTSFKPSTVLKGDYKIGGGSKAFRNGLVVFQFVVSLSLAIFSVFVYQQLNYGLNKELGFEKEGVIVIDNAKDQLGKDYENVNPFKNQILQLPSVSGVSANQYSMIGTLGLAALQEIGGEETYHRAQFKYADAAFVPTMDMKIVDGRNFDEAIDGDDAIIVNEAFAKMLGDKLFTMQFNAWNRGSKVKIVGVVEDFHYADFSIPIGPTVFFKSDAPVQLNIKVQLANVGETLEKIEAVYAQFTDEPLDYYFFDQKFDQLFSAEKRMSQIIAIFTGLSLFVAFLGLVGLISYKLDQRTKEIGIRKVLGASIAQILSMLSKEMLWLIGLAFLISVPLAYYAVDTWMNGFAYHISLSVAPFVTVGALAIAVIMLIVIGRSIKTAMSNPTQVLRNE